MAGRLIEMADLAARMPLYFIRNAGEQRASQAAARGSEPVPSDVALFLQRAMQQGKYHAVHIVLVDFEERARAMERLNRYLHGHSAVRTRIALIGSDFAMMDTDSRLLALGEPAWTYHEARSLREAMAGDLSSHVVPLAQLRARFVASVLGKEAEPTPTQLGRIRIDQE